MYYLNRTNFWQYKHAIAILFTAFLCFVSINFRESVIKLVAIRKAFANCKRKYLGKILKIGQWRNICKECENVIFLITFLNSDIARFN